METSVIETQSLSVEHIQEMIRQLSITEKGEPLSNAMDQLKVALKENPAACSLLLPEDIGSCVAALKLITGKQISDDLKSDGKKGTRKAKVNIDQATLEGLSVDELM